MTSRTTKDRFDSKWSRGPGDCWTWHGSNNGVGYGEIRIGGRKVYAHRWSYEHHVGPIPDGLQIDHLCRNRACVNPDHLEPVTPAENVQRGEAAGPKPDRRATHCVNGHPYGENTYTRPDGRGRNCIQCVRDRSREYQRRKRAQKRCD